MPPSRNSGCFVLFAVTVTILSSSVLSKAAAGQDDKQIKGLIQSVLKAPSSWRLTGFEEVASSSSGPWRTIFHEDYRGYAATCEDIGRTIEESGGKADGAGNAQRHPMFSLWFLRRNASVTPAKVQQDLQKFQFSALQAAVPKLLGFNQHYVVTCNSDCSEQEVTKISEKLKLQSFSSTGNSPR